MRRLCCWKTKGWGREEKEGEKEEEEGIFYIDIKHIHKQHANG